jgi:hypothetical protein
MTTELRGHLQLVEPFRSEWVIYLSPEVMPMVRVPKSPSVLFWFAPLVFVIVFRLLMPSIGE